MESLTSENNVFVKIIWLQSREAMSRHEPTVFELTGLADEIAIQSVVKLTVVNSQKGEPECEHCGAGLCDDCVQYLLDIEEYMILENLVKEAEQEKVMKKKRESEADLDSGFQRYQVPKEAGKRTRYSALRPSR